MRRGLLNAFGAMTIGTRAAIERMNEYYSRLRPARLLNARGDPVHPIMQARLDAASRRIRQLPANVQTDVERSLASSFGGLSIRPNANNNSVLSLHSFGWAVDLRASLNPNFGPASRRNGPRSRMGPVAAVTGRADPLASARVDNLDFTAVERIATDLRETSSAYTVAMADDRSLSAAMLLMANRARRAASLPDLPGRGEGIFRAAAEGMSARRDQVLDAIAAGAPASARVQLAGTAGDILLAMRAYRASFDARGRRVRASATSPTAGTIAAHGFMSLHPALVAALAARDAGGLFWLGTSGVHDYMHFELPSSDTRGLLLDPSRWPAAVTASGPPPPGPAGATATPATPRPARPGTSIPRLRFRRPRP